MDEDYLRDKVDNGMSRVFCLCCLLVGTLFVIVVYSLLLILQDWSNVKILGEFPVQDEPDITMLKPYEYIYGQYERGKMMHNLMPQHCFNNLAYVFSINVAQI